MMRSPQTVMRTFATLVSLSLATVPASAQPAIPEMPALSIARGCGGCPIPIELAMREFQARHKFITGDTVEWPDSDCGDPSAAGSKRKAPPFPPDGFYGDALCDPREARVLVDALYGEMAGSDIYQYFRRRDEIWIEGAATSPSAWEIDKAVLFGEHDINLSEFAVTESNYCLALDNLWDVLQELRWLQAGLGRLDGGNSDALGATALYKHCDTTDGGGPPPACYDTCGEGRQAFLDGMDTCLNALPEEAEVPFIQFGVREIQVYYPNSALCPLSGGGFGCHYERLALSWTLGGATYTSGQQRGRGHTFLKIGPPDDSTSISNRPPPPVEGDPADELFHQYGSFDTPSTWHRDIRGDYYGLTAPPNGQGIAGWKVQEPMLAVLEPEFERHADSAAVLGCSACEPGRVDAALDGVSVRISLGTYLMGDAGYLLIRGDTLVGSGEEVLTEGPAAGTGASEMKSPRSVSAHVPASSTYGTISVINTSGGVLRQVKTPTVLVNLTTQTSNSYLIAFHDAAGATLSEGLWTPAGSAFRTITVTHAMALSDDPNTSDPNAYLATGSLRIDEAVGVSRTTIFKQIVEATNWTALLDDEANRTGGSETTAGTPVELEQGLFPAGHDQRWVSGHVIWELARAVDGGGVAEHREVLDIVKGTGSSAGERTESRTVYDSADEVMSREVSTYAVSVGGGAIDQLDGPAQLLSRTVYPSGTGSTGAMTVTLDTVDTTGTGVLVQTAVQEVTDHHGHWEKYEYDSQGRVTKIITQFLDGDSGSEVEEDNRSVQFVYHELELAADDRGTSTHKSDHVVEKIEKLLGNEVARSYTIYWVPDETSSYHSYTETTVVRSATLGSRTVDEYLDGVLADPLAVADLVSHTRKLGWPGDVDSVTSGKLSRRFSEDGTVTVYTQEPGASGAVAYDELWEFTETVNITNSAGGPLAAGGEPCPVENGTRPDQVPGSGTRSVLVQSAARVTLVSETFDMNGTSATTADDLRISLAVTTARADDFGRATEVEYLDGTVSETTYACCGVESETDREGITTSYVYDDLRRLTHTVRAPGTTAELTMHTVYDGAGRVLQEVRIGADDTEIVQRTNTYDLSGRLLAWEDALENVTTVEEWMDDGLIFERTTMPDPDEGGSLAAPEIDRVSYPDGSLKSVGGTGAHAVAYEYGVEQDGTSGPWQRYTKVIQGGPSGTQWVKTVTNALGQAVRTVYPVASGPYPTEYSEYDNRGRLWKRTDADGVVTLSFSGNGEADAPAGAGGTGVDWDGDWSLSVQDFDDDGAVDFDGSDRISMTRTFYTTRTVGTASVPVRRTETRIWTTNADADATYLASTTETTLDGLESWSTVGTLPPQTTHSTTVYAVDDPEGPKRTVTTNQPSGATQIDIYRMGRMSTSLRYEDESESVFLGGTAVCYDPHGRAECSTVIYAETPPPPDSVTDYEFNAADQLESVTGPYPNAASPYGTRQTITYSYDHLGRRTRVDHGSSKYTDTTYTIFGEVESISGFGVTPVKYEYDALGRLWKLKTYKDFSGLTGLATTTWVYDSLRGWLTGKLYNTGYGPSYTYKPSGRLHTRTWNSGKVTTYSYNEFGELEETDYSSANTPDVGLEYDRMGRLWKVHDAAGVRTFTYDADSRTTAESIVADTVSGHKLLEGVTVYNSFDTGTNGSGLRTGHTAQIDVYNSDPYGHSVGYEYDALRRLATVSKGNLVAGYEYDPVTGALTDTTYTTSSEAAVATGERVYDRLGRLTSIRWDSQMDFDADDPAAMEYYDYSYDAFNRRTGLSRGAGDDSDWQYAYDDMGQLTEAFRIFGNTQDNVPGDYYGYDYDDVGNRTKMWAGGDEFGGDLYDTDYTANALNQYTQREVSGNIEVLGESPISYIEVNGDEAWRNDDFFHGRVSVNNTSAPVLEQITVLPVPGTASSWEQFVAETPEVMGYDLDGNLQLDGVWEYTWDGENRLKSMQMVPDVAEVRIGGSDPWVRIEFEYDWLGRRISKKYLSTLMEPLTDKGEANEAIFWEGDLWQKFVWDGWMLSMSYRASFNSGMTHPLYGEYEAPDQSYAWGPDLSSSQGGAGGIGGLAIYRDDWNDDTSAGSTGAPDLGCMFPIYDGNGNVTRLYRVGTYSGSTPTIYTTAAFEYGPFGEVRSVTGSVPPLAAKQTERFPFRWSTKYTDVESGLVYYGYRYYAPWIGRWISRDPIGEGDGPNAFGFVRNSPLTAIDSFGLCADPCDFGTKHEFKFVRSKQLWKQLARERAGLVSGDYQFMGDPQHSWLPGYPALAKDIYRQYRTYYFAKPDKLLWAGAAALAGRDIVPVLEDTNHELFRTVGIRTRILKMTKDIFEDLAWQHTAYLEPDGGLAELRAQVDAKALDQTFFKKSWCEIDHGNVEKGNTELLEREQYDILQPTYQQFSAEEAALITQYAVSPIPGLRSFSNYYGRANAQVTQADRRFGWMISIVMPHYFRWTDAERQIEVQRLTAGALGP